MYVCVCNAITEKSLREGVKGKSLRSAKHAYRELGCEVDCGQCLRVANDVLISSRVQEQSAIAAE